MLAIIYIMIGVLFLVYISWTWNNTRGFDETSTRIIYIIIGTLIVTAITFIIYLISKNGIIYPNENMVGIVRNMILCTFVPINGFIILPQIANIIVKVKKDEIDSKKLKKRIIVFFIITIIAILFECSYFKDIQARIIEIIKLR